MEIIWSCTTCAAMYIQDIHGEGACLTAVKRKLFEEIDLVRKV